MARNFINLQMSSDHQLIFFENFGSLENETAFLVLLGRIISFNILPTQLLPTLAAEYISNAEVTRH